MQSDIIYVTKRCRNFQAQTRRLSHGEGTRPQTGGLRAQTIPVGPSRPGCLRPARIPRSAPAALRLSRTFLVRQVGFQTKARDWKIGRKPGAGAMEAVSGHRLLAMDVG